MANHRSTVPTRVVQLQEDLVVEGALRGVAGGDPSPTPFSPPRMLRLTTADEEILVPMTKLVEIALARAELPTSRRWVRLSFRRKIEIAAGRKIWDVGVKVFKTPPGLRGQLRRQGRRLL